MANAISSVPSSNQPLSKLQGLVSGFKLLLKRTPDKLIEIVCPTLYVKYWLEEQLSTAQSLGLLPVSPIRVTPVADWEEQGLLNLPLEEQIHLIGQRAGHVCWAIYGHFFMPEWFQKGVVALPADTFHYLAPDTAPETVKKHLITQESALLTHEVLVNGLQSLVQQSVSPSDILVLCPNTRVKANWIQQLAVMQLPVWGLADGNFTEPENVFSYQHLGVRVLTLEEAGGIATPYLFLPEIEQWVKASDFWPVLSSLEQQISQTQTVYGSFTEENLPWHLAQKLQDWLSSWDAYNANIMLPLPALPLCAAETENTSFWTESAMSSPQTVVEPEEVLRLSPSSLETYLHCPRKFFYQSMLGLTEPSTTPQAMVGTLVHRILEVFNRKFERDYTLENLLKLTEHVFDSETHKGNLTALGFRARDIAPLNDLPPLQKHVVYRQIRQSFEDLSEKGYFEQPFTSFRVEETLMLPSVEGLEGIHIQGRADLIRTKPDGSLEIVDYKTSRSQFKSPKEAINQSYLTTSLEPVDWEEPDLSQRYAKRAYQLPLYWLMLQYSPQYAGKPTDIRIQMVRPPDADPAKGGCNTFGVDHETLKQGQDALLDLLRRGVAEPLRNSSAFFPLGNPQTDCVYCPYTTLCEGPGEDPAEQGGFEE